MPTRSTESGMTLMEVLIAITFIAIALLALLGMLSTGYNSVAAGGSESKAPDYDRQEMELLKRVGVAAPRFANGNDTPETGVARNWTVAAVGATVAPNRLWRVTGPTPPTPTRPATRSPPPPP